MGAADFVPVSAITWHLVLWILWQTLSRQNKNIYPCLNKWTAQKGGAETICTLHPQWHSTGWSCLSHAQSCRLWPSLWYMCSRPAPVLWSVSWGTVIPCISRTPCFYWGNEIPQYSVCCCRVGQNNSSLSPNVTGEQGRLWSGALGQDFSQGHLLLSTQSKGEEGREESQDCPTHAEKMGTAMVEEQKWRRKLETPYYLINVYLINRLKTNVTALVESCCTRAWAESLHSALGLQLFHPHRVLESLQPFASDMERCGTVSRWQWAWTARPAWPRTAIPRQMEDAGIQSGSKLVSWQRAASRLGTFITNKTLLFPSVFILGVHFVCVCGLSLQLREGVDQLTALMLADRQLPPQPRDSHCCPHPAPPQLAGGSPSPHFHWRDFF